jgi:hypothetical protein
MKIEGFNLVRITLEKQNDSEKYEVQGIYEFTEDVYNNYLWTPNGDLEKFLQTAPRKKLH